MTFVTKETKGRIHTLYAHWEKTTYRITYISATAAKQLPSGKKKPRRCEGPGVVRSNRKAVKPILA